MCCCKLSSLEQVKVHLSQRKTTPCKYFDSLERQTSMGTTRSSVGTGQHSLNKFYEISVPHVNSLGTTTRTGNRVCYMGRQSIYKGMGAKLDHHKKHKTTILCPMTGLFLQGYKFRCPHKCNCLLGEEDGNGGLGANKTPSVSQSSRTWEYKSNHKSARPKVHFHSELENSQEGLLEM